MPAEGRTKCGGAEPPNRIPGIPTLERNEVQKMLKNALSSTSGIREAAYFGAQAAKGKMPLQAPRALSTGSDQSSQWVASCSHHRCRRDT